MKAERVADPSDAGSKALYRSGGISAILLGVGCLIIFPLYAQVGAPPHSGEAWMKYLAGKTSVWWVIVALSVLTDVLFIPFALSLHRVLRDTTRT